MSDKSVSLPPQDCVGEWCPVLLNLNQSSRTVVGMNEPIKVVSQPPEVFHQLEQVAATARNSAVEIMGRL